jgi:hypothetical protein
MTELNPRHDCSAPDYDQLAAPNICRGGKYSGPEHFLCWQKEKREGRKRGKRKKRKKKEGMKKNRKKK